MHIPTYKEYPDAHEECVKKPIDIHFDGDYMYSLRPYYLAVAFIVLVLAALATLA